ncbi:class E sortase [Streptomyces lunaelactis]|uniref:class E sortase n=1 Tax=Streptomyces lunaelactis TaxID=1535768 RepID=UPI0015852A2E|nr:class E sortase [Streptomyces lunaelactis]NUK72470.1 class E sortase [Streptomyces lunaelactis]NUK77414.1 class E sortase [Streptomyces lunaelactis]
MVLSRSVPAALAAALLVVLAGCSGGGSGGPAPDGRPPAASTSAASTSAASTSAAAAPETPRARVNEPATDAAAAPTPQKTATPTTEPATLSIPSIGLKDLRVVPYEGTTDDWPGTRIQNRGVAASPYGPKGGVGPGEVGNYLVTAHRISFGGPLRDLPSLKVGETVVVTSGGSVYEYEITGTRTTSFRSERSLAEQRAPVPGHPGERPTKAMITISTCATPEDNAAGNFWRDDRGNPEHRIDKIGVLRKGPTPDTA